MAFRNTLLANLNVSLANTTISTSSELPFTAGGVNLYDKNMKKLYLDNDQNQRTQLFSTIDNNDVFQQEILVNGYLTVDAKNQPSDISNVITRVVNSRFSVANCYVRECEVTNTYAEDRITYNFEFRFLTI
jgi:hypothetical protein